MDNQDKQLLKQMNETMGQLVTMVGKVLNEMSEMKKEQSEMRQQISSLQNDVLDIKDSVGFLAYKSNQHDKEIYLLKRDKYRQAEITDSDPQ